MPGFPVPGRPGGEHDEPLLDMIIARRALPPDAPQEMHDLARMLAALAGPAEPGELAGEAAVRAAFSRAASPVGISSAARRPVRRRRPRHRGRDRSRARLAVAMVAAAAGLGSVLAAYSDVLPSPIQQLAHVAVAAPAPPGSGRPAALGTGRQVPHKPRPASRPAPGPHHSASAAQPSAQPASPTPHYSPLSSSPGHRPTEPACSTGPWGSPSPPPKASAHPSPLPSWSQEEHCTGIPTGPAGQPTLNPYVP
jgi:hypothetical protein